MTLCTDDEEAAGFEHSLAGISDLRFLLDDQCRHLLSELGFVGLNATGDQLFARQVLGATAKLDVDATTGHVGGDRDGARTASLSDDLAFALGVLGLGVEDRVWNPALRQHRTKQL
ncbi:unannotated protein [freshwater metagenome]|uniref:Unannotated protein n=1 Tax=freshwater metagenome TaxID=449393 RepID=A0A6J5ZUU8_9ZZZZ